MKVLSLIVANIVHLFLSLDCKNSATANRISQVDTSNLVCQLGAEYKTNSASVSQIEFDFWYAVGSHEPTTDVQMNAIENSLFVAIMDEILWCYGDGTENAGDEIRSYIRRAGLRNLQQDKKKIAEEVRRLGIIAVNSGPADIQTDHQCPPESQSNLNEKTQSSYCTIYKGKMSILAHQGTNLNYMIAGILDGLERAMDESSALMASIPDVTFLQYLGDSEEEAFPTESKAQIAGGKLGIILGLLIPFFVIVLIFAIVIASKLRKQRAIKPDKPLLIGTGDPPDSYHEGLYHYMSNGTTRYISTRCKQCQETLETRQYAGNILGTIYEDVSCDIISSRASESLFSSEDELSTGFQENCIVISDSNNPTSELSGDISALDSPTRRSMLTEPNYSTALYVSTASSSEDHSASASEALP